MRFAEVGLQAANFLYCEQKATAFLIPVFEVIVFQPVDALRVVIGYAITRSLASPEVFNITAPIITRDIDPKAIPLPLRGAGQGIQLGETRLSVRRGGLCEKLR